MDYAVFLSAHMLFDKVKQANKQKDSSESFDRGRIMKSE